MCVLFLSTTYWDIWYNYLFCSICSVGWLNLQNMTWQNFIIKQANVCFFIDSPLFCTNLLAPSIYLPLEKQLVIPLVSFLSVCTYTIEKNWIIPKWFITRRLYIPTHLFLWHLRLSFLSHYYQIFWYSYHIHSEFETRISECNLQSLHYMRSNLTLNYVSLIVA